MKKAGMSFFLLALVCNGCAGLSWTLRDLWQKPETIIESLAIQPGDHVADLGAGKGYFTFRLADAVGPTGKVYAVDVNQDRLESLARRAKEQGYANVEVVLGKYNDPLLPQSGVDLIFICNTYHHLENQVDYFKSVVRYLRPNGHIAVVEPWGRGWLFRLKGHGTLKETVRSEIETAGYLLAKDFDFLTSQHFQVFLLN